MDYLKAANTLAKEHLNNLNDVTFWDLDVCIYTTAITVKQQLNDLKEININPTKRNTTPKWINHLEESINKVRKQIGQLQTVIKCKTQNVYTNHQKRLIQQFDKRFGNTRMRTLEYKLSYFKQELKAKATKLKYEKRKQERKKINQLFGKSPKGVYRNFKGNNITVKDLPSKENLESFWKGIWGEGSNFNKNAKWLKTVESNYCKNAIQKEYKIERKTLDHAISKLYLGKAPGRDLITGYWYKKLDFYKTDLIDLLQRTFEGKVSIPNWLSTAKTTLVAKNEITNVAKNYRPIACLNILYKIYTSCLNTFLQDHCETNNIVTLEQAGGKRGVWGCTEQLLLNKCILNEVKHKKRNLINVWLDYRKAFDSVPHDWMIHSLRLAKVPECIIHAIETLSNQWSTILNLVGENYTITSELIEYLKGIFQGDSLSVLLFILSVNPLSFLLRNLKGYSIGDNRQDNITHNFFVDDLKLYGSTINIIKKQLDLVTTFSKDICMDFGVDKCAYVKIEKGKLLSDLQPLTMNDLIIEPVAEGDVYKYLGQDENIGYDGPANKARVIKEYCTRVKKIWSSQLSAFNKVIAHNSFAVPVIIPSIGILDWCMEEIKEIDIRTRKILCMTHNFHPKSDVDRLYTQRACGGRGLRQIQRAYESRIIAIRQHLIRNKNRNRSLDYVHQQETNGILRVGQQLLETYDINVNINESPRKVSKTFTKADQEAQKQKSQETSTWIPPEENTRKL